MDAIMKSAIRLTFLRLHPPQKRWRAAASVDRDALRDALIQGFCEGEIGRLTAVSRLEGAWRMDGDDRRTRCRAQGCRIT
jgi:hypothetical protein